MSDLTITRGDDTTLDIAVVDEDTGEPVDITGADLRFWVKRSREDDDDDALLKRQTGGSGIGIPVGTDGLASVTIPSTLSDDLEPGVYWWELEGVLTDSVKTLAGGRIRVTDDLIVEPV